MFQIRGFYQVRGRIDFLFVFAFSSEREYLRGDEVAWYADSDNVVRNEYNPMTAYAFGNLLCTFHILLHSVYRCFFLRSEARFYIA